MLNRRQSQRQLFDSVQQISKLYTDTMAQLQTQIGLIQGVTESLDTKISTLLRRQQQAFFRAYQSHLNQLTQVLKDKDEELESMQRCLQLYSKQNPTTQLMEKVRKLQEELSNTYSKVLARDKVHTETSLQIRLLTMQNKRLRQENKQHRMYKRMLKTKSILQSDSQQDVLQRKKTCLTEEQMFITGCQTQSVTKDIHLFGDSQLPELQVNIPNVNQLQGQNTKLLKQVKNIRRKYGGLLKTTVQRQMEKSELKDLFFSCVQEVKRNVKQRRKISKCQPSDLLRQDKIKILLKLLADDRMVEAIHRLIFQKQGEDSSPCMISVLGRTGALISPETNPKPPTKGVFEGQMSISKSMKLTKNLPQIKRAQADKTKSRSVTFKHLRRTSNIPAH